MGDAPGEETTEALLFLATHYKDRGLLERCAALRHAGGTPVALLAQMRVARACLLSLAGVAI